jgi:hypothetical protein
VQQFHAAFHLLQRESFGAFGAQPEIFKRFAFGIGIFCMEAKKSASIHAHEHFGTMRIGTLRDHESVAVFMV